MKSTTIYSVVTANDGERQIDEAAYNELRNDAAYFEYADELSRALFQYSGEYTNHRCFPAKGVEKCFDKSVFLALIRKESDYRKRCKEQNVKCPKRFVVYNEGGLQAITPVDSGVRITSTTEEERQKKKSKRLRDDGIDIKEESLERLCEEFDYEPESDVDVEAQVGFEFLPDELWGAVDKLLSEKDAFILKSYYRDGLTEPQIAEILGIARQNVGKRRKKALAALLASLQDFKIYLS